MTQKPTRRAVLSAIGAASALVGVGATSGDDEDDSTTTQRQTVTVEQAQTVTSTEKTISGQEVEVKQGKGALCTLACNEAQSVKGTHGREMCSEITLCNCSPCTRTVTINVSGELLETGGSNETIHIGENEQVTLLFTGSLTGLDMESGDINVAVSQRSLHESNASQCKRGCTRC